MKFTITKRVNCGVGIPDGKNIKIGEFTFLPDFEGENYARHIQVSVEASTQDEAIFKSENLFSDFLAELALIDDSKYSIGRDVSVKPEGSATTTTTRSILALAHIVQDGNTIKNAYEKNIMKKKLRKKPIRIYAEALNSIEIFEEYRNFYKVLECYGSTGEITDWIKGQTRGMPMKKDKYGSDITVFIWIRHKLSHSKKGKKGVEPLLLSNSAHIALVSKYLPDLKKLARGKIKDEEKI